MKNWHLRREYAQGETARHFANLDTVFALSGENIAQSTLSQVIRIHIDGRDYYVKRYSGLGKRPFRRLFEPPRVKLEWKNLRRFAAWGVPTAPLVAYGRELSHGIWGKFTRGALITLGVPDAKDLRQIVTHEGARAKSRRWWDGVSRQLAHATRTLHAHKFVHNDLKWRNLLVDGEGMLYLIDCPSGRFWFGPFLSYRIIKDLACLDKMAKYHLSKTQRLRFYLDYAQKKKLDIRDKQRIRKITVFFEGRE